MGERRKRNGAASNGELPERMRKPTRNVLDIETDGKITEGDFKEISSNGTTVTADDLMALAQKRVEQGKMPSAQGFKRVVDEFIMQGADELTYEQFEDNLAKINVIKSKNQLPAHAAKSTQAFLDTLGSGNTKDGKLTAENFETLAGEDKKLTRDELIKAGTEKLQGKKQAELIRLVDEYMFVDEDAKKNGMDYSQFSERMDRIGVDLQMAELAPKEGDKKSMDGDKEKSSSGGIKFQDSPRPAPNAGLIRFIKEQYDVAGTRKDKGPARGKPNGKFTVDDLIAIDTNKDRKYTREELKAPAKDEDKVTKDQLAKIVQEQFFEGKTVQGKPEISGKELVDKLREIGVIQGGAGGGAGNIPGGGGNKRGGRE